MVLKLVCTLFLFCSLTTPLFATTCASTQDYIKCVRLPYEYDYTYDRDYDYVSDITDQTTSDISSNGGTWSHYRDGVLVQGTATIVGRGAVECVTVTPFVAKYSLSLGGNPGAENLVMLCANAANAMESASLSEPASALPGDVCPDGFFTAPYEKICGQGMVDIEDVPMCDDDTSGITCLIKTVNEVVCTSGISMLKTSTNVSFVLYDKPYTSPAMNVMYNNKICYGKMQQGRMPGSINVLYNGKVYHLTD